MGKCAGIAKEDELCYTDEKERMWIRDESCGKRLFAGQKL